MKKRVFAIDVKVCATAYIRAASKTEARDKARKLAGASPQILVTDVIGRTMINFDHPGEVPISGRKFNDPKLPDVSLSPAMTINGFWRGAGHDHQRLLARRHIRGEGVMRNFTDTERDTVLAALRLWQHTTHIPQGILDIATDGDKHPLMDDADIDALCEEINV